MVDIAEVMIKIKGDSSSLESAAGRAKGSFGDMESGAKSAFSNIGSMAVAGFGIAAAAIAAFAIKSFEDVDGAYKKIQASVGATADQMNNTLKPAFDSVFGNFAMKADEASAAVAKVYSGLKNLSTDGTVPTTVQLTEVTSKFAELAAIGGTEVGKLTASLMPAFKALGVSASEIPAALNSIVIAAQGTGDKVDTLVASVAKAAPTFKQFGFGIEDTAAVMAKLDISGVNSSQVLTALNKVLKEAATSGEPPKKALADLIDQLEKGNISGKEATAMYKELGVKGFAAFKTAVQGGAFDVQALTNAMGANTDQLDASYQAQRTFSDKLTEFKNKLEVAFSPLGKTLVTLMENVLSAITPVLPIITGLVTAFTKLPMPIQMVGIAIAGLIGGAGMLKVVLGKLGITDVSKSIEDLIPRIKDLATDMSNVPSKVLSLGSKIGLGGAAAAEAGAAEAGAAEAGAAEGALGGALGGTTAEVGLLATIGPLLLPVVAIVAAIAAGFAILYATSGTFRDMVGGILNTFKEIVGWVGQLGSALMSGDFSKAGDLLKSGFTGAIDAIKNFDYGEWAAKMVLSIKESLGTIGSVILDGLSSLSNIADKITDWLNKIDWDQVIKGLVDAITGLFGGGGGGGAGAGATTAVSTGMNKSLIDGATKAAPQVLAKLVMSLGGLVLALSNLFPNIAIALGKALLNGLIHLDWGGIAGKMFQPSPIGIALLNAIKSVNWGGIATGLGTATKSALTGFGTWLLTASASFFTGLPAKFTAALVGLGTWLWTAAASFVTNAMWAVKMAAALIGLGTWLWTAAISFVTNSMWATKMAAALIGLGTWLWTAATSFVTNAQWAVKMAAALVGLGAWLWTAAVDFFNNGTWASRMAAALVGLGQWMLDAASSFFSGLSTAVQQAVGSLNAAAKTVSDAAVSPGSASKRSTVPTTTDGKPVSQPTPYNQGTPTNSNTGRWSGISTSGTNVCSPGYHYVNNSVPYCPSCGVCVKNAQSGGIISAAAGGTPVIVGEGGEDEAIVPRSLWDGIDPTLLASLQGYAKGGVVKSAKSAKSSAKAALAVWDKSQLSGSASEYYNPSMTADQMIAHLTAVAVNTKETKEQLQKQINLVNTYYPLYGKAASSTIDTSGAISKLTSEVASIPGGFKAGGATATTPGAWEDLKTHKWNYQTSDQQVAYLTEMAVNTKETTAQLQKQVNDANTYYKASGRDTSKISDATTLLTAYGAKIAEDSAKTAANTQAQLSEAVKNAGDIAKSAITGITDTIKSVFEAITSVMAASLTLQRTQAELALLPASVKGEVGLSFATSSAASSAAELANQSGSIGIVTALSGESTTTPNPNNSVTGNIQLANLLNIQKQQAILAATTAGGNAIVSALSSLGTAANGMIDSLTKGFTSSSTSGTANTVSAVSTGSNQVAGSVNSGTDKIVSALSSMGGSGGSVSGIFGGITQIINSISSMATAQLTYQNQLANIAAMEKQPKYNAFGYEGSYYVTHSTVPDTATLRTLAGIQYGSAEAAGVMGIISGSINIISGMFSMMSSLMGGMGGFQTGGVAWHPTIAKLAETEPELITPLSKLGKYFGTPRQYNITVYSQGDENDATIDRIADRVIRKIKINEFLQSGS